jgi:hypothetical protein
MPAAPLALSTCRCASTKSPTSCNSCDLSVLRRFSTPRTPPFRYCRTARFALIDTIDGYYLNLNIDLWLPVFLYQHPATKIMFDGGRKVNREATDLMLLPGLLLSNAAWCTRLRDIKAVTLYTKTKRRAKREIAWMLEVLIEKQLLQPWSGEKHRPSDPAKALVVDLGGRKSECSPACQVGRQAATPPRRHQRYTAAHTTIRCS